MSSRWAIVAVLRIICTRDILILYTAHLTNVKLFKKHGFTLRPWPPMHLNSSPQRYSPTSPSLPSRLIAVPSSVLALDVIHGKLPSRYLFTRYVEPFGRFSIVRRVRCAACLSHIRRRKQDNWRGGVRSWNKGEWAIGCRCNW